MKMVLRYGNLDVVNIDMYIFPEGIQVSKAQVIDKEKLPYGLKPAFSEEIHIKNAKYFLEEWLMARSIPDYRQNIDEFILSLHHLPRHLFGRMNGYQHTAAVLSYFASHFDQYYVTPVKEELICFANIDSRFKNLYLLQPAKYQYSEISTDFQQNDVDEYLKGRLDKIYDYKGFLPTMSFTIPSMVPSWWMKRNETIIMMQKCTTSEDKKRAQAFISASKASGIPGNRFFDGEYLYSDYTFIKGTDTTWLREYLPYLETEKSIQKQIKEVVKREFGCKSPIDKLFMMDQLMEQEGFSISLSELGIAKKWNNLMPVAIF